MPAHADASPSSSSIWLNCPASVTKARGRKRIPTVYTSEGSAAHEVAEILIYGIEPPDVIHTETGDVEVDEEMLDAVKSYVAYVEQLKQRSSVFLTETKVKVTIQGEPLFGTADVIAYQKATMTLEVVDLKYGKGVFVPVAGNTQLRIYALGALLHVKGPVETVRLTIIQPRMDAGFSSVHEDIPVVELLKWQKNVLAPALGRLTKDDPTETPGPHCRWCVRAGECASLAQVAQEQAKMAFDNDAENKMTVGSLDNQTLASILDSAELILAWVKHVQAEVSQRIDRGQHVPGWKLVARRGMTKWNEADKAFIDIKQRVPETIFNQLTKLKTPKQVEEALKRARIDRGFLGKITNKESTGSTLVPDTDERQGVVGVGSAKTVFSQLTESLEG